MLKGKGKSKSALVICDDKVEKRYRDVILAAITSHIPENIMEMELILEPIETTGLVKKSLFKVRLPDDYSRRVDK